MPVTTTGAANLLVPNIYVYIQNVLQAVNPYINTALNAFVGVSNWGALNQPIVCGGPADIFNNFGTDTVGLCPNGGGSSVPENLSLIEEMLTALPEDGSAVAIRVDDGTSAASVINLKDTSSPTPTTQLVLTADFHGSLPLGNASLGVAAASARVDLVSGTTGLNPVVRLSIFFPGAQPEVFDNIPAYATIGGALSVTSYKANVIAAVNGTLANSVGSQRWTASSGFGASTPNFGTAFSATGGSDGYTNVNFASLIGTPFNIGTSAAPTGMYALTHTNFFHLVLCGLNDLSQAPTVSAFVLAQNAALGFATVPSGTSDPAAFALRLSNSAIAGNMVLVKDYIKVFDSVNLIFRLVSPLGKAAGIIGLLPPFASPINEPWNTTGIGAGGVVATEQTILGYPRSESQLAALITNGFIAITNQIPINNGSFGIFDDVTSAGSPQTNATGKYISDQRMTTYLAQALNAVGGQFVGQNQTTQANDPTRMAIRAAYNNLFAQITPPGGVQWVDNYKVVCDLTNNSPATIAAGFCYVTVLVKYLGVIRILYVTLQGGTAVQTSLTPPPGFPGA